MFCVMCRYVIIVQYSSFQSSYAQEHISLTFFQSKFKFQGNLFHWNYTAGKDTTTIFLQSTTKCSLTYVTYEEICSDPFCRIWMSQMKFLLNLNYCEKVFVKWASDPKQEVNERWPDLDLCRKPNYFFFKATKFHIFLAKMHFKLRAISI